MANDNVDWDAKERRIVTQNALSHATQIVLAVFGSDGVQAKDFTTVTNEVKKIAAELVDFVYNGLPATEETPSKTAKTKTKKMETKIESTIPAPTVAQKEILDYVAEKTGLSGEEMYGKVLDFIEKKFNKRVYATKLESMEGFEQWLSEQNQ